MVIAADFVDPFQDDVVAFPINLHERTAWQANLIQLIIGAIIFLAVVAVYNALFSIWEKIFQQRGRAVNGGQDLSEQDDIFVRVTYAIFVSIVAYLIVWYVGPPKGRQIRRS